jgi:ABC-type molybdate transport system permease subunit
MAFAFAMGKDPFALYSDPKAYSALMDQVGARLIACKPNFRFFLDNRDQLLNGMRSGELHAAMMWDSGGWKLAPENPAIKFIAPKSGALGWMILLRETGVLPGVLVSLGVTDAPVEMLYRHVTILVGLVYTSLLFMVIPLYSSLESLYDSLIEAAYDLGGNGWTVLRTIVIPHAAPGITAGCIVVFMLTLGNYLTASLLGGKNSLWFTEQIYTQFITRFNWEQGAAFGFLLLLLSSLMVWIGLRLSGQKFSDVMSRT